MTDCACHSHTADPAVPPPTAPGLRVSRFRLPGMDCPSEGQTVRLCLQGDDIAHLDFDYPARTLTVHHTGTAEAVARRLAPLGFGCETLDSAPTDAPPAPADPAAERRVLWQLMAINAALFVIEVVAGWWAESTGLLADGLDMLADAAVYALALAAIGASARRKLATAHLSGGLQAVLGAGVLFEVGRRMLTGAAPHPPVMLGIALLALAANLACVWLLHTHRDGEAHMRASWIFTANDALANLGVILAGALVAWLDAPWPDWLIGSAIGLLILSGAWRILKIRPSSHATGGPGG